MKPRSDALPPPVYRIVVAGALGASWSERASGMAVVVHADRDEGTTTELIGPLADQAALIGVIDRLYSYGARLLSVECLQTQDGAGETLP